MSRRGVSLIPRSLTATEKTPPCPFFRGGDPCNSGPLGTAAFFMPRSTAMADKNITWDGSGRRSLPHGGSGNGQSQPTWSQSPALEGSGGDAHVSPGHPLCRVCHAPRSPVGGQHS